MISSAVTRSGWLMIHSMLRASGWGATRSRPRRTSTTSSCSREVRCRASRESTETSWPQRSSAAARERAKCVSPQRSPRGPAGAAVSMVQRSRGGLSSMPSTRRTTCCWSSTESDSGSSGSADTRWVLTPVTSKPAARQRWEVRSSGIWWRRERSADMATLRSAGSAYAVREVTVTSGTSRLWPAPVRARGARGRSRRARPRRAGPGRAGP